MPETESTTSHTLLQRVGEFDPDAWERLARLYSPLVYRWCRKSGLHDSDVDDVMQEVFRAVANGVAAFAAEPGGKFRAWLWGITRNKIADHFRKAAGQPEAIGGSAAQQRMHDFVDVPPEESSDQDFDADAALLHRALKLLQPEFEDRTWRAFWQTTIGGEKASVVAGDLGMTTKAVRQAKYRILRRLRLEMDQAVD